MVRADGGVGIASNSAFVSHARRTVAVPCNGTVASKLFLSTTFLGAFFSYYYLLLPLALENTQRQFVRYSLELFVADQGLGHGHNRPDACGEIGTFERDVTSSGGHSRQPRYYSVPGALPKDGSRSIGCIEVDRSIDPSCLVSRHSSFNATCPELRFVFRA